MIEVLINKCHGGFGISNKGLMELIKRKSELVQTFTFKDWFGTAELTQDDVDDLNAKDLGDGYFGLRYGGVAHPESQNVFACGMPDDFEGDSQIALRTHPDLLALFDELGDELNTDYSRLAKITITDWDVKVSDIEIGEYDGSEWVAEKHRVWG